MGLYLGLDSSTQGLKAMLIDAAGGAIVATAAVNYSQELPLYQCPNGFLADHDPLVKRSDPLMWAEALDLVLGKLRSSGAPLDEVKGVSGSGQQHGSVYVDASFERRLRGGGETGLAERVRAALSRRAAPIWMDSSTSAECREITAAVGDKALRELTGSPAVERFTGPQIRKFFKEEPEAYGKTDRVHLVSSFMASLLVGANAPIDFGDGSGMNLLNLKTLKWDEAIAAATAPGLLEKLPPAVASGTVVGGLASYFARYGLRPGVPVLAWSGDNPCSLVGMGAASPGTAVISLGTSDTFFAALPQPVTDPAGYGHVFGNPAGGFMCLICFKNGSLARERVKDLLGVDWEFFGGEAFATSEPGCRGNLMLPYFVPEITPLALAAGPFYRGDDAFIAGGGAPAERIRAVVEAQALSMKLHSGWIGGGFRRIRVTGGASRSPGVCQTLADVFQAPLEKISVPDSATLGAAMLAARAVGGHGWEELAGKFAATSVTVEPDRSLAGLYAGRLEAFAAFERETLAAP